MRRRASWSRTVAAVAVAAVVVAGNSACSSVGQGNSSTGDDPPPTSSYVPLATQTYGGTTWQLFAWTRGKELCMQVLTPTRVPTVGPGGCGFNGQPSGGHSLGGIGPGGSTISFGPVPANATRIRVASKEVLTTVAIPAGHGLPDARYWVNVMPPGWPTSTEGSALDEPQPLDRDGRAVAFTDF